MTRAKASCLAQQPLLDKISAVRRAQRGDHVRGTALLPDNRSSPGIKRATGQQVVDDGTEYFTGDVVDRRLDDGRQLSVRVRPDSLAEHSRQHVGPFGVITRSCAVSVRPDRHGRRRPVLARQGAQQCGTVGGHRLPCHPAADNLRVAQQREGRRRGLLESAARSAGARARRAQRPERPRRRR